MKAGDHIVIPRPGGSEHGIDVGDRTAIVFDPGKGPRRVLLGADGSRPAVVTHAERAYAPKQVVARAFSRFSESAFSAMFPTSEAFAVWCKTGRVPPGSPAAPAGAPPRAAPRPRRAAAPRAAGPAKAARASPRPTSSGKAKGRGAKPSRAAAARAAAAPKKAKKKQRAPGKGERATAGRKPAAAAARRKAKPAPKRTAAARGKARARGR